MFPQKQKQTTTKKGFRNMSTKEKTLPAVVEEGIDNDFYAPSRSEYQGELSVGPVSFKSKSKSSDSSSSVIGGVMAGGAVAIGAVAVTLTLLGIGRNS